MNAPMRTLGATQRPQPIVPVILSDAIAYALRMAQEASFEAYLQRVGNANLKPGRYALLTVIDANPGLTPSALARIAGRDKSTVTPALRDLEARGCLSRIGIIGDRRSYAIELTPSGHDLLAELRRHARAHDAHLAAIVGPDRAQLMTILARIARALDAEG